MKTSKIDEPLLPTVVTSYGTHEDTNDEDCVGGVWGMPPPMKGKDGKKIDFVKTEEERSPVAATVTSFVTLLISIPALVGSWCWPILLAGLFGFVASETAKNFAHSITWGVNLAVLTNLTQYICTQQAKKTWKKTHWSKYGPVYFVALSVPLVMADLTVWDTKTELGRDVNRLRNSWLLVLEQILLIAQSEYLFNPHTLCLFSTDRGMFSRTTDCGVLPCIDQVAVRMTSNALPLLVGSSLSVLRIWVSFLYSLAFYGGKYFSLWLWSYFEQQDAVTFVIIGSAGKANILFYRMFHILIVRRCTPKSRSFGIRMLSI